MRRIRKAKRTRTTIASLLCFTIFWTSVFPASAEPVLSEPDIYRKYPNARVIHVSPEDYPALASTLSREGYRQAERQVALNGEDWDSGPAVVQRAEPTRTSDDCRDTEQDRRTGNASLRLAVDSTNDAVSGHRGGSGDAIVLFVIIGAVVLVVWTLYAFKYLFDLAAGRRPCGYWSDLTFSSTWASGDREASARFSGVRYRTGAWKGSTGVGIAGEIGRSDLKIPEESLDLRGNYWLLGPLLRWRVGSGRNPHYFQMEFLAGSTENKEVGVIAQAKMGLSFGVGDHFRWGGSVGALNINLNETGTVIQDRSQYHYLFGLEMGYRF